MGSLGANGSFLEFDIATEKPTEVQQLSMDIGVRGAIFEGIWML